MTNIWLNHWFSTAYSIIALIKENSIDYKIIGSNENKYSSIKLVCDEWFEEPPITREEYLDYCIRFCREHNIQVFIPHRESLFISKNKKKFEDRGVKVLVDDFEIVSLLNHKAQAYEYFKERSIGYVPEYFVANTVEEFSNAYDYLKNKYEQICFKLAKDEGGKSFRLIDNKRKGYSALLKKQNTRMTYDAVIDALSERKTFDPILIMPFLPGKEVSVDCLMTENGLIALPRFKGYEKYETLRFDEEIISICNAFQNEADLKCPYNIQFKYLNNIPYFLEVNTRMSGGIHMACHASGVNIPQIAVKKLMGQQTDWTETKETKIISQVLEPKVIG